MTLHEIGHSISIFLLAFMIGRNLSKIKTLKQKLDSLEDECTNLRITVLKMKRNEFYHVKIGVGYVYDFNRDGTPDLDAMVYFPNRKPQPMDFTLERAKELAKQYNGEVYGPDGKVVID